MDNNLKIYLGVDWGEKRIGLAIGDSETKIASPFGIAKNVNEIAKIIKSEGIDVLVVGKPVSIINYQLAISNKKYNDFIVKLKKEVKIPFEFMDERLSSKAADARLGGKKTKATRDEVSAMIILEDYLGGLK